MNRPPLPDFEKPPVTEVALDMQFEALPDLRTPRLGALWTVYRERGFPVAEDHPTLAPLPIEKPDSPPPRSLQLTVGTPTLRQWFVSQDSTKLLQVQNDRFVHNWRRTVGDAEYPRYESLRESFAEQLAVFLDFAQREDLGEVRPTQCELTYVNEIVAGEGAENFPEAGSVLTTYRSEYSDGFLTSSEGVSLSESHLMCGDDGRFLGRLYVDLKPARRVATQERLLKLTLRARGRPTSPSPDGVLEFFDLGRSWIVNGFASITTPTMHRQWRRSDV